MGKKPPPPPKKKSTSNKCLACGGEKHANPWDCPNASGVFFLGDVNGGV